jgi:DNA replicative helicase MCM subunit Mcm2 (Cdc46/Mcm family)
MTIERKVIFGLEDIKALVFECNECSARVSISPRDGKSINMPSKCPQCPQKWLALDLAQHDSVGSPVTNLISSIERLRAIPAVVLKEMGFRILLEFDEPKV